MLNPHWHSSRPAGGVAGKRGGLMAGPPRFLMAPRSKTVPEGSHVRFLCLVSGEPQPRVRYTHDGKDPKDATVTYLQDNLCCLDVGAVTLEHAGLYRVELSNPSGVACVETHLEVTGKETKVVPSPPKVLVPLRDTTVEDGQSFTLSCEVSGQPPPSAVWSRDGIPLAPSSQDFQVILDGCGTILLLVREAFPEDSARFACRLRNPSGEATTSCMVTVRGVKAPAPQDIENVISEHTEKQKDLQAALVNGNDRVATDHSTPVKRRNQLQLPGTHGVPACLSLLPISTCSGGMKRRNNSSFHARTTDHAYSVLCPFLLGNLELPAWLKHHVARLSTNSRYARTPIRTTISLPRTIQNCVQICLQLLSSGALSPAMNATFSMPGWYRNRQHAHFAITASESDAQMLTDSIPPCVPKYCGFPRLCSDSTGVVPDVIFSSDASTFKNAQTATLANIHSGQTCARVLSDTNSSCPEQPLSNGNPTNYRRRPPADLLPPEQYEVHSPTSLDDDELVPAQIIRGPQSVVTQIGADVRLNVRFVGVPVPKVTWIRAVSHHDVRYGRGQLSCLLNIQDYFCPHF
ncbi:hemicentin-1-like isoform X2 [Ornithodoros turicata]|uniref:hemicentin-1-like isoform X2 n=1 Tax=Ornithodoros turicata TaxID=34597 RepID=UPI003139ECEC